MCSKALGENHLENLFSRIEEAALDETAIGMSLAELRGKFSNDGKDLTAMAAAAREELK